MKVKTWIPNLKQKIVRLFCLILEKYWAMWANKWQQDFKLLGILEG